MKPGREIYASAVAAMIGRSVKYARRLMRDGIIKSWDGGNGLVTTESHVADYQRGALEVQTSGRYGVLRSTQPDTPQSGQLLTGAAYRERLRAINGEN